MNITEFVSMTEMNVIDSGVDGKEEWFALKSGGVVSFEKTGVPGASKLKVDFKCVLGVKTFKFKGTIYRCPGFVVLPVEKHQVSKTLGDFNTLLTKYKIYVEMADQFVRDPSFGELIQNAND